ncbi:hypothetical protein [Wolbachia endosymbiont of Oedothorax gibbosus]|uniref:hypothetical protein n=1 Tax=Wolbachia endosymbiont of Oedothorax gibbosus TaxID=931100 RepID=UPI002024DA51|nr:hypothetical protein [Wolbachia endosymbiont of Oedothorax gibbosus]
MGNSTKELVNAFNLNNYACDKIDTNFTVEGKEIVGLFASGTNIGEYLRRIGEEIIKRHYIGGSEVAHKYYNSNCFPFVLGTNLDKEYLDNGIVKVKLADSTNPAVIHNLKIHFANEFKRAVGSKVVARLQKLGVTKEEAYEWIEKTVGTRAIGMPYLYYIAFNDEYFEWERECDEDPSETFEMLKEMYIREFNSRLEVCGLKSSDFYEYKDDMLYIKDVSDKVVKSVARYVKKEVALDFRTPGSVESKVENCKNVLSELIYQSTGKSIYGYDYDIFTDEKKIRNGSSFALIPFIKVNDQLKSLSSDDARNIDRIFNKEINKVVLNGFVPKNYDIISDIRGKTANPQFVNCKKPVYAFSNKQIALLLPMIMRSPIAYNQINERFEFAADLGNFKRRGSSRSSSEASTPTHLPNGSIPGLHSRHPSSDKEPGSLLEKSQVQGFPTGKSQGKIEKPPRQGSMQLSDGLPSFRQVDVPGTSGEFPPRTYTSSATIKLVVPEPSSSQSVNAAQNVQAGTSAWDQPIGYWSSPPPAHENNWPSPAPSAGLWSLPQSGPSSWKGANESGSAWTSQPIGYWSSQSTSGNQWMQSQQLTEPGPSCSFWQKPSQVSSFMVNESSSSGCKISNELPPSNKLNNKEKELIEALLYTLNLMNYTLDGVYTNFFAKDGKIVSLLHDTVDREEYLQEVRDYIIEEYCEDEEEASKVCDLDEFPFKLNYEEKQEKTVVANISRGALSNLKILFSRKSGKTVDAIDIDWVKEVEKHEKNEWVDRQLSEDCTLKDACISCLPDKSVIKVISIVFNEQEGEYVLDRNSDISEVRLLYKEQLQRAEGTLVAGKGESDLTEEEKKLFKALLYAFNYSNHNLDCPDTNFTVKNGKITSLIDDSVNVKEYLQKVRGKTEKKYYKDKKEDYDFTDFPFEFLSNCEKNQKTTVVANISRGALFNLKKLFIQEHKKGVKIEDIDINIVEKTVKSKKLGLVELKEKGIEREAGYYQRIYRREAVTASYPDESALECIPIRKYEAGYCLDRTYDDCETQLLLKERLPAKSTKNTTTTFKKIEESKKDDSSSGYSSGFVTDAENVSSKAEATTSSGYESMDCENTREGLPKRKPEEPLEGSPEKSLRRDSSPCSRLESLSLSNFSHQTGKY